MREFFQMRVDILGHPFKGQNLHSLEKIHHLNLYFIYWIK